MPSTPSLLETQQAMLDAIAAGNTRSPGHFIIGDEIAAEERVNIYRNTTINTLVKALRLAHPAIHRLVGTEFFEAAAQVYLKDEWPKSALLDEFGASFGHFLDSFAPAATLDYLGEVARLEWAVHCALHAVDAPALDLARLAAVPEAQMDSLRFFPHPSVELLSVFWPAEEIWRAVIEEDDAALGAIELERRQRWLIVQRSEETGVHVQRVPEAHWRLASTLCAGASLGDAIAATPCAASQPGHDEILGQLLAAGRFCRFAIETDAGVLSVCQPRHRSN